MRMMYEPAGNVLVVGAGEAEAPPLRTDGSCPSAFGPPVLPGPPAPPASVVVGVGVGRVRFAGNVTVNGAVAREISTPCFCRIFNRSACVPGRGSSPGSTYAAGPSVRAFRIDRLLVV